MIKGYPLAYCALSAALAILTWMRSFTWNSVAPGGCWSSGWNFADPEVSPIWPPELGALIEAAEQTGEVSHPSSLYVYQALCDYYFCVFDI